MENKNEDWKPWMDLPPDKEDELISKLAHKIIDNNLGFITLLVLESGGRLTDFWANFSMGLFFPYLDLLGLSEITALFRKNENRLKLIEKIEKLKEEREK